MSEVTFTIRLDETLKDNFTTAAKASDRTGAQLLRDFMRDFVQRRQKAVEYDEWFRREVQAGIEEANAGDLIPDEVVRAKAAARRTATLRKIKKSGK